MTPPTASLRRARVRHAAGVAVAVMLVAAAVTVILGFSDVRRSANSARAGEATSQEAVAYATRINAVLSATDRATAALHTHLNTGDADLIAEYETSLAEAREARDTLIEAGTTSIPVLEHTILTQATWQMTIALESAHSDASDHATPLKAMTGVYANARSLRAAADQATAAAALTADVAEAETNGALERILRAVSTAEVVALLALTAMGLILIQRAMWTREREALLAQVAALSRTDPLTGLSNRRALAGELGAALHVRNRSAGPVLLMVDLDGFKAVNDVHGHGIGDQVLALVGAELSRAVRHGDTVARLGGDEFVVLARHTTSDADLSELVRRVRGAISDVSDAAAEQWPGTPVSVSVGVARPEDVPGWETLTTEELAEAMLAHADSAMYADKRTPRARA